MISNSYRQHQPPLATLYGKNTANMLQETDARGRPAHLERSLRGRRTPARTRDAPSGLPAASRRVAAEAQGPLLEVPTPWLSLPVTAERYDAIVAFCDRYGTPRHPNQLLKVATNTLQYPILTVLLPFGA
jgi:hypothetical protein